MPKFPSPDLMPIALRALFPRWRSTDDGRKAHATPIVVKYFTPDGGGSWFITEACGVLADDNGTEVPIADCHRDDGGWYYRPAGTPEPKTVQDVCLFGLCDLGLGFPELGYVSLLELEALRGQAGLPVEIDLYWKGSLADAEKAVGQ